MIIQNANTIDANLTNAQVGANSTLTARAKSSPLELCGTRVRLDGEPRTGTAEAVLPTPTDATQSNASNFASGDSTLARVSISVAHLSKTVHTACPANNQGLNAVAHLIPAAINELEKDIADIVAAKYVSASLGAADVSVAAASFAIANLKTLIGASTAFPRVALLSTTAMLGVSANLDGGNYPGLAGVFEHNLTGADGYAVVTGPSGLAYVVEQPRSLGAYYHQGLTVTQIELPTLKIPAWQCVWWDLASRTQFASVDLLFGCAIADATATAYAAAP